MGKEGLTTIQIHKDTLELLRKRKYEYLQNHPDKRDISYETMLKRLLI